VVGYDFKYMLNGRTDTVRMDHAPGDRIPVREDELAVDAPKVAPVGAR